MNIITIKLGETAKDSLEEIVKPYLLGKICHSTDENSYYKIIESGYIKYSKPIEGYRKHFGINNKAVCLADFRNINKNKEFLDEIIGLLKDYIFILKENEYDNIIPPKTQEEFENNKSMGWLIPEYECWYKSNISLEKIENVYHLSYRKNTNYIELFRNNI